MNKGKLLQFFDKQIYNFLINNVDFVPHRIVKLVAMFYTDARVRKLYWEKLGVKFGEGTFANLGFNVIYDSIENLHKLSIGKNISIAPNLTLILDSKPNNSQLLCDIPYVKENLISYGSIKIEDDVWIGANVTIFPNVTVRKGTILGAGSVVMQDTEEFCTYAGVPAKKIRKINNE